ncbi:MAG: hypothetical protein MJ207_01525 [Bacilli bacterium]|nr:hypothetical protein [Bacilli bacterium]
MASDFDSPAVSYNNPAVLVVGNTQDESNRDAYNSSFDMYGGYIRSKVGPKLETLLAKQPYWAFKCIQPRGEGATVNMSYGDLYSHSYCISGQGNPNDKFGGTEVNISGGTIVGGLGHYPSDDKTVEDVYVPLFFPQGGTLKITGGNITGPSCLDIKTGTIEITGGIFTATRKYDEQEATTSGSTADGSVILLESVTDTYSKEGITVKVNDATMTSKSGYITNIIGKVDYFKDVTVTHTGGTYYYAQENGTHINDDVPKDKASITVTGGTWIKGE